MKVRFFPLALILISLAFFSFIDGEKPKGNVKVHAKSSIKKLVEKHKKVNEKYYKTDGFRVQVFSVSGANSRDRANLMKAEFLQKYPDAEVYIVYHAPSYKVRLGNFRTKLDALGYLQTIKDSYPFAFVAVDKIELLNNK